MKIIYHDNEFKVIPEGVEWIEKPKVSDYPDTWIGSQNFHNQIDAHNFIVSQLISIRKEDQEKVKRNIWESDPKHSTKGEGNYIPYSKFIPPPYRVYEVDVKMEIEETDNGSVDNIVRTYVQLPTHMKIQIAYEMGVGAQDDKFEGHDRDKVYIQRLKEKSRTNPVTIPTFWNLIKMRAINAGVTYKTLKQYSLIEQEKEEKEFNPFLVAGPNKPLEKRLDRLVKKIGNKQENSAHSFTEGSETSKNEFEKLITREAYWMGELKSEDIFINPIRYTRFIRHLIDKGLIIYPDRIASLEAELKEKDNRLGALDHMGCYKCGGSGFQDGCEEKGVCSYCDGIGEITLSLKLFNTEKELTDARKEIERLKSDKR